MNAFWFALLLTLLAGLSTGIGSLIALFAKRTNKKLLSIALGFSAGVMIYIAFVELLNQGTIFLVGVYGFKTGSIVAAISFFGGMGVAALIDKLIPEYENPHEAHALEEMNDSPELKNKLLHRMGLLSAVVIAIHNFPEGIVTFASALSNPSLGIAIAVAVAIHNIPEGIAVAIPIYYSTGSRKKAFVYSFLSGLAEPIGAIIAYLVLREFFSNSLFGILFAIVAGIMVFISLDELLPAAQKHGEHHLSIYGLIAGMAIMAFSLLMLL
ncbi:MAG: zinc transporter ZupT [Candidatus Woesearchaeota archaeon]|jgi:ZIP family zinc transporter